MQLLHIALATIAAMLFVAFRLKLGSMKELDRNRERIKK